jgi:hypothetical protein
LPIDSAARHRSLARRAIVTRAEAVRAGAGAVGYIAGNLAFTGKKR